MCGIAGSYSFEGSADEGAVRRMMTSLIHRGPDGEGFWKSQNESLAFGHRRLSITDFSDGASQPMHYSERYIIVFNGAIYNHASLREQLLKKGYTFKTKSDTEIILASFQEYGEDCLNQFEGMFAFAIYDSATGQLFCARDRFGEKPFYFHFEEGKQFLFASEIKALLSAGVNRNINHQRLFYFLAYDVVENPFASQQTFFEGIEQLEAAHSMIINRDGSMFRKCWWKRSAPKLKENIDEDAMTDRFFELIETSVHTRMLTEVNAGSALSGGIDSSAIAAIASRKSKQPWKTFSMRFHDFEKDEGPWIQGITSSFNINGHECFWKEEISQEEFSKIIFHQDEPFNGASVIAQWQLMKCVKEQGVKVLLDGQGADELLGGYFHFFKPFLRELFFTDRKKLRAEKDFISESVRAPFRFNLFDEIYFAPLRSIAGKVNRRFFNPAYMNTLNRNFIHSFRNVAPPFVQFDSLNESLNFFSSNYGLGKLLRFADRNSMSHSVELRMPFLHHQLAEFIFSLPASFKIRQGWTKFILRKSMEKLLPEEITWRKDKIGFEAPQQKFLLQKNIREIFHDSVLTLQREKILNKKNIPHLMNWNILIAGQWLKNC